MINISAIRYDAELVTETGARYTLNDALVNLQWEGQKGELAQRATLVIGNMAVGGSWLMDIMKINCIIEVYATWGSGGRRRVFDGIIWEWDYKSATQKELTVTAYDQMIKLQQSKDFRYYPSGMTTRAIISDICGDWGVPLSYEWDRGITHEKKVFSGEPLSEMIIGLLEDVRKNTGDKYVAFFNDGYLRIKGYGTNDDVYRFDVYNTESTSNKISISGLVTKVKIIGKQDNEGRAPVEAIEDGDLRFGVLQEIIHSDSAKNLSDAIEEARTLLKERGRPEETIEVSVPDLPFVLKGDRIYMAAGNLLDHFCVEGVSHNATERKMTLDLSRFDAA
jgi:hypothetical protein